MEYIRKNWERYYAYQRKWRYENREKVKAWSRQYYLKNRDRFREYRNRKRKSDLES